MTPSTTATVGSAQTISPGTPVEDTTRPTVQAADPGSREIVMSPSKTENTPGAPAHDIQLQFNQDGQRVDVRVSESSGEVRVAVRTPDSQLAGALRQDLPHLSSQLEQTGFRAETWHPGLSDSPASIERRTPANGSSLSDPQHGGQNQNRQEDQQQQQPRSPKPNATPAAKSQRREFQWLISQLR
ncbi:MAG: hypothetical protein JO099_02885 [Acidobacteriia bacterium]|nr:hypothetical protein [Terriglobia bacterium]